MLYDYFCAKCDKDFEIEESMSEHKGPGECPTCKNISNERIFSKNIQFIGTAVQHAEYNPGLGQIVKSSQHRKDICKEKGLIEVGSEKKESMHKHFDDQRAEKKKKMWDNL